MVAEVVVLAWGLFIALARLFPGPAGRPVRFLAVAYTDLFRGFPAIIVIYLVVIGIQAADIWPFNTLGREDQLFWLSVTALVLVYGAYVSEVYRAGLESIHWSQTAAARSLGLGHGRTMRYVVVPQAVRRIIPPLLNDEITSALDPELVSEVLNIVRELAAEGMTMLLATHEMGFAKEVATKVCFLSDGIVLEEGPPARIFGDPEHERTRTFLRRIIEAGRL